MTLHPRATTRLAAIQDARFVSRSISSKNRDAERGGER